MTRPVICAIDVEHTEAPHIRWSAQLARTLESPLQLAHVAQPPGSPALYAPMGAGVAVGMPPLDDQESALDAIREQAQTELERLAAELGAERLAPRVITATSTAEGLRSLAEELRAQLLVVGSRGHGAARAALLGSTSHDLATRAPCPVVIVSEDAAHE